MIHLFFFAGKSLASCYWKLQINELNQTLATTEAKKFARANYYNIIDISKNTFILEPQQTDLEVEQLCGLKRINDTINFYYQKNSDDDCVTQNPEPMHKKFAAIESFVLGSCLRFDFESSKRKIIPRSHLKQRYSELGLDMNVYPLWIRGYFGNGITIAFIDSSGVNINVPNLKGRMVRNN